MTTEPTPHLPAPPFTVARALEGIAVLRSAGVSAASLLSAPAPGGEQPQLDDNEPRPARADCGHRGPHPGFTCAEVDQTRPYWNVRWDQEQQNPGTRAAGTGASTVVGPARVPCPYCPDAQLVASTLITDHIAREHGPALAHPPGLDAFAERNRAERREKISEYLSELGSGLPIGTFGGQYLEQHVAAEFRERDHLAAAYLVLARLLRQTGAGRQTWIAKAEELEADRDRHADVLAEANKVMDMQREFIGSLRHIITNALAHRDDHPTRPEPCPGCQHDHLDQLHTALTTADRMYAAAFPATADGPARPGRLPEAAQPTTPAPTGSKTL
ncbi:hypothetical protein ACFUEN_29145 [Streptomyces griseorubiginosus]|uniref:hypothetical protein n=1 Tax=Streptomyces griseorubiginosus TaxID=67304 RepID=UPI00362B7ECD